MGTGSGLGRAWDCCVTVWCVCVPLSVKVTNDALVNAVDKDLHSLNFSTIIVCPLVSLLQNHKYLVYCPEQWAINIAEETSVYWAQTSGICHHQFFCSFKLEDKQTNVCTEQTFYLMTSHHQWHNGCVEGSPCAMVSLVVVGRSCC